MRKEVKEKHVGAVGWGIMVSAWKVLRNGAHRSLVEMSVRQLDV